MTYRKIVRLGFILIGLAAFFAATHGIDEARAQGPANVPGGAALPDQTAGEPYAMAGDRIVFTNWYYVKPGVLNWKDDEGKPVAARDHIKLGDWGAHFVTSDMPRGIQLTAQKAERYGPVIKRKKPWEEKGTVLRTLLEYEGKFRMYAGAQDANFKQVGCYYESDDGYHWTRPNLDMIEYDGNKQNNLTPPIPGYVIFVDPSAPAEERFKTLKLGNISPEDFAIYKEEHPDGWEPLAYRSDEKLIFALRGGVSADGFHWTSLDEPLSVEHADTLNTGYYDTVLKKYVMITRTWWVGQRDSDQPGGLGQSWYSVGRRSIGRTESDTFGDFPASKTILLPPSDMLPSEVLYSNCKTTIPGAPDNHLLFPAVWNMDSDVTRLIMAASSDGRAWNWVPGGTVLETGEFGQFDGGTIFATPNLVELPNGDFVLPYSGFRYPHKYPRGDWEYYIGYAVWPKGRIVALEAEGLGEFSMVGIVPPGNRLRINAVTKRTSSIRVAVCGMNGEPLPGRSFDDCKPIIGDQYQTLVTWGEHEDMGVEPGEPVVLKFKLNQARIFALDFE